MATGNGSGRYEIDTVQLGAGWIFIELGKTKPSAAQQGAALSGALTGWLKQHPDCCVRSTLPIVSEGETVGVHLWYTLEP